MKRCPHCGRDYNDDSLSFCLDDGAELLFGPAKSDPSVLGGSISEDEPATAIIGSKDVENETATRVFASGTTGENIGNTRRSRETKPHVASRRASMIAGMIGIVVITALGVGSYFYFGHGGSRQIESIAVMPFVNEGGDPEIEYLSDGMTETLIGSLSQVPNLNVKARSSVFRYKGKEIDVAAVGRELNVQAVLNGRLVQRGNDIAVYLELIDPVTENVLFKTDYLRQMSNLVLLQKEIAQDVAKRLREKLTAAEQQEVEKSYTQNPEAYRLYLQGRYHWNKRRPDEHRKAISYYEQAIALDASFALAYAGLADCYAVDSSPVKGDEGARLLQQAAERALQLDPTLGQPHAALANGYWDSYDWAAAERELKIAIELEPNYPTAHQWYGELLSRLGRHDEAIAELKKAAELDPLSLIIASDMIYVLANARRYDEALEQARKTLELDANWAQAHFLLTMVYELKGDIPGALKGREGVLTLPGLPAERKAIISQENADLRNAFERSGPEGYWRTELAFELADRDRPNEHSPYYLAEVYSFLNEKDKAFEWLNRAIDSKDDFVDLTKVSPSFDNLRSDPRWPKTLERLNLKP